MTKKPSATKIAEGLGLAAGAAASYYFYGKSGKKHRRELEAFSQQAKTEMTGKIKHMKALSKTAYDAAARQVLAKYRQVKNIKPEELKDLGLELKKHWAKISQDVAKLGKKSKAASRKK